MTNILSDRLKIIVPTINSERYLEDILSYYKHNDVDVIVLVDAKSIDGTRDIASRFFDVVDVINETDYVEHVIGTMSEAIDATWLLRIDDDELPSLGMLRYIDELLEDDRDAFDVVGFARHQCLVSIDGKLVAHTGHDAFHHHRQWRLYRNGRLPHLRALHTPGLSLGDPDRRVAAPDEACMIHLDWVVRDYSERRAKLARYDAIQPGVFDRDRSYYLVEEAGVQVGDLAVISFPEFDETLYRLSSCSRKRRLASWKWSIDATRAGSW